MHSCNRTGQRQGQGQKSSAPLLLVSVTFAPLIAHIPKNTNTADRLYQKLVFRAVCPRQKTHYRRRLSFMSNVRCTRQRRILGDVCDVVTKGYLDVNLAITGPQTLQCGCRGLCAAGGGSYQEQHCSRQRPSLCKWL